jgi:hypothetical protein
MVGPVEESAKVAHGIVDVMKGQPMVLALVLFNLLFAILVFLGSKDFRANQLKLMELMIQMTGEAQQLLAKCVTPPAPDDRRGENSRDGFRPAAAESVPLPPLRPLTENRP